MSATGRALTTDPVDSSPGIWRPGWWCRQADGRGRRSRQRADIKQGLLWDCHMLAT